jgi:hypothetical protein
LLDIMEDVAYVAVERPAICEHHVERGAQAVSVRVLSLTHSRVAANSSSRLMRLICNAIIPKRRLRWPGRLNKSSAKTVRYARDREVESSIRRTSSTER